ncbi:hypothetical protein [Paenibacillus qinlingensis]|uniref:DUF1772 domain-containing protein n=1 Tax=Paenibacillus qinlingensis TaxID=1837343 RepID=A0ABU1NU34_9BACL|nr:hypothetical protein [Paenibacillus qinlingensis]MDR6550979.1 hypothetical protein [Paenibacillus qinlingensis]
MKETSDYFDYLFWGSLVLLIFTMYAKGLNKPAVVTIDEVTEQNPGYRNNANQLDNSMLEFNYKLLFRSVTFWLSFGGMVIAIMMSIAADF